jgi:hypothetical protein
METTCSDVASSTKVSEPDMKNLNDPLAVAMSEDDDEVLDDDGTITLTTNSSMSTATAPSSSSNARTAAPVGGDSQKLPGLLPHKNQGSSPAKPVGAIPVKEKYAADAVPAMAPRANSIEMHVSKFEAMKSGVVPTESSSTQRAVQLDDTAAGRIRSGNSVSGTSEAPGTSNVLRNVSMFDSIAHEKKKDTDKVAANLASLKSARSKPAVNPVGLAKPLP